MTFYTFLQVSWMYVFTIYWSQWCSKENWNTFYAENNISCSSLAFEIVKGVSQHRTILMPHAHLWTSGVCSYSSVAKFKPSGLFNCSWWYFVKDFSVVHDGIPDPEVEGTNSFQVVVTIYVLTWCNNTEDFLISRLVIFRWDLYI